MPRAVRWAGALFARRVCGFVWRCGPVASGVSLCVSFLCLVCLYPADSIAQDTEFVCRENPTILVGKTPYAHVIGVKRRTAPFVGNGKAPARARMSHALFR